MVFIALAFGEFGNKNNESYKISIFSSFFGGWKIPSFIFMRKTQNIGIFLLISYILYKYITVVKSVMPRVL